MKKTIFYTLSFFILYACSAQKKTGKSRNTNTAERSTQLYNQGIQYAQNGQYKEAISYLEQVIYLDSNHVQAYLSLAGVYGQIKNYSLAAEYYSKAIAKDPVNTGLYNLPYSINLAGKGDFEKAAEAVNTYLSNPNLGEKSRKAGEYRKRCFDFAVHYAEKNPAGGYSLQLTNLGPEINTADAEYFPSLTIDGKELIFTRRVNNFNEDFFKSTRENNNWELAAPLPGDINTPQNEGAQMISQDGQWLVFTGCNRRDGWGSCDIYISYLTPEGWSEAINLGGVVNSDQWDSQPCLSPDKRDLYFASRRTGGYGGSDLYVCHLQDNGKWSLPENLGPEINTAGDESSPFIHADNQTLYFTSNGLQGYGDDDIFYSRKGPKGDWSVPVNLGYPINTIDKEGTLFISADAKTAYYASDRSEGYGSVDLYRFELRENIRPFKTLWVRGNVYDEKTKKALPSTIELIDLSSGRTVSKVQTDEGGNYLVTLPVGKNYAFNVNRKGYLFYSDNFSLSREGEETEYEKNIPLHPIEKDAVVVLKNIFFEVNEYALQPPSLPELNKVVDLLNNNPTLKLQISGHTDATGNSTENLTLSQNRAKAVVSYLVSKGIQAERLTARGYGAGQPVASNDTEEGRAQNRRTEMKVISQ